MTTDDFITDPRRACADGVNPDLFFSTDHGDVQQAKKVCRRCPLIEACGRYADQIMPAHGVWAGVNRSANAAKLARRKARRAAGRVTA